MSEQSKHSPEPWQVEDRKNAPLKNIRIVSGKHDVAWVTDVHQRDYACGGWTSDEANAVDAIGIANAIRIVDCVNACNGIQDPMALREQRDELLEAAKFTGGGDSYTEEYGRTCHCQYHTRKGGVTRDGMLNPENHSTACNKMWESIAKAESAA